MLKCGDLRSGAPRTHLSLGIEIGEVKILALVFADDIVLCGGSEIELSHLLGIIWQELDKLGGRQIVITEGEDYKYPGVMVSNLGVVWTSGHSPD